MQSLSSRSPPSCLSTAPTPAPPASPSTSRLPGARPALPRTPTSTTPPFSAGLFARPHPRRPTALPLPCRACVGTLGHLVGTVFHQPTSYKHMSPTHQLQTRAPMAALLAATAQPPPPPHAHSHGWQLQRQAVQGGLVPTFQLPPPDLSALQCPPTPLHLAAGPTALTAPALCRCSLPATMTAWR